MCWLCGLTAAGWRIAVHLSVLKHLRVKPYWWRVNLAVYLLVVCDLLLVSSLSAAVPTGVVPRNPPPPSHGTSQRCCLPPPARHITEPPPYGGAKRLPSANNRNVVYSSSGNGAPRSPPPPPAAQVRVNGAETQRNRAGQHTLAPDTCDDGCWDPGMQAWKRGGGASKLDPG